MNLKKDIQTVISAIEAKVGKLLPFLVAHISVLLTFEQDFLAALKDVPPILLSAILPPNLIALIPNFEAVLTKAIQDTLVGSKILTDFNNAAGLEAKLQILQTDLSATPALAPGVIRTIILKVLGDLNGNNLTPLEYSLYLNIKQYLGD